MTLQERFSPQRLIATACEEAGTDDFGDDGWQPGLERLTDGLINEARLSAIGVEIAYLDIMRALKNRLGVIAWRKEHPEIATKPITTPIVIVGQPRSGTTILYDLLAQDPDLRAPADVGGRCALSRPAAGDVPHRSPNRADAGEPRTLRADHPRILGLSSDGRPRRAGVRPHHGQ